MIPTGAVCLDVLRLRLQTLWVDERWNDLARTLGELGMWRHLPADVVEAEMREVAGGRYPFMLRESEMNVRWFFVDGEEMAEGHVADRLRIMTPALSVYGVTLTVDIVDFPQWDQGEFVVLINGHRCRAWRPDDWTDNSAWKTATIRPLAVVNDLLAEAGALPRLFTLYAGANEGIVWLLDPRIIGAVDNSNLIASNEIPRLATLNCCRGLLNSSRGDVLRVSDEP